MAYAFWYRMMLTIISFLLCCTLPKQYPVVCHKAINTIDITLHSYIMQRLINFVNIFNCHLKQIIEDDGFVIEVDNQRWWVVVYSNLMIQHKFATLVASFNIHGNIWIVCFIVLIEFILIAQNISEVKVETIELNKFFKIK